MDHRSGSDHNKVEVLEKERRIGDQVVVLKYLMEVEVNQKLLEQTRPFYDAFLHGFDSTYFGATVEPEI